MLLQNTVEASDGRGTEGWPVSGLLLTLRWVQKSSLGEPLGNPLSPMIPISPSGTHSLRNDGISLGQTLSIVTTELYRQHSMDGGNWESENPQQFIQDWSASKLRLPRPLF